jgi:TonB family protein
MRWRDSTGVVVVGALLVGGTGAGACARNPPPAGPAPSTSGRTSDAKGQNLGGLYFDPQGADFTVWINQFKNQVYRNWIVPQAALAGIKGHVDFEFIVERNGSMSALRLLKSSGTPSLDRAAQNALTESRFAPLPDDYHPPRVTMDVAFFYNQGPQE